MSKAIALVTTSSRTHAGVVYAIDARFVYVAESQKEGFVIVPYEIDYFEDLLGGRILTRRSRVPIKEVQLIIDKYVGLKYGFLDLIFILLYVITGKILFKDTTKRLICSEAVARVLYDCSKKSINFEKEFNKPFSYITPDDLNQSIQLKDVWGLK